MTVLLPKKTSKGVNFPLIRRQRKKNPLTVFHKRNRLRLFLLPLFVTVLLPKKTSKGVNFPLIRKQKKKKHLTVFHKRNRLRLFLLPLFVTVFLPKKTSKGVDFPLSGVLTLQQQFQKGSMKNKPFGKKKSFVIIGKRKVAKMQKKLIGQPPGVIGTAVKLSVYKKMINDLLLCPLSLFRPTLRLP